MPPESMPPEPMPFSDYQAAFAARIRDPGGAPLPPGAPARRMRVYQELLFNNLEGFLLACYPVSRELLGARAWKRTLRRFFQEHRCHSPLFRDIPRAFLDWMREHGQALFPAWPFLGELLHYEWLELAVSIAPDAVEAAAVDPAGDLLAGRPALAPGTRLACYRYPVHRIGRRHKPAAPDPQAHCYLLYRDAEDTVRFIHLNPLSARLLELLRGEGEGRQPTGREALVRLAGETGGDADERFIHFGGELLRDLREQGALLGTWRST